MGDTAGMTRNRMWLIACVVVGVLAVAGTLIGVLAGMRKHDQTAQSGDVTVAQVQAYASQQAALPKCADVFQVGKAIDQAKAGTGCLDPEGNPNSIGNFRCTDGGHLWSVSATTGAPTGWGFSGKAFHASKKVDEDPAYASAYHACVG